jgi:hypothetical protein
MDLDEAPSGEKCNRLGLEFRERERKRERERGIRMMQEGNQK